jgi:hypothetical protein
MQQPTIAHLRLTSQRIGQADFKRPEDVVRHMLAMQAQDYTGALWSIGLRMTNSTQEAVEEAIKTRKIVRTWPMRGTLHFLHADDAKWMVKLLAHRATQSAKGRRLALGLDDMVMTHAEAVVREALSDGKSMRRDELMKLLSERVTTTSIGNQEAGHVFRNLAEHGVLCFGVHDGKQPTFVLMDEWIPDAQDKEHDEAVGLLAERYFVSHGPATLQDFAGWGFMTMTEAKQGLEIAGSKLTKLEVDGLTYYMAHSGKVAPPTSSTFLLPGFDEYILGYKDRRSVLATEHSQKVVPGNNGMFLSTIIVDGAVVGTWKHVVKAGVLQITPQYFDEVEFQAQELLVPAAQKYANFIGHTGKINFCS